MSTMEKRLKSKMKKSDPNNYSIHDFLNECKSSDAADTRFDDGVKVVSKPQFVVGVHPSKLGNLYRKVASLLRSDKSWDEKSDDRGRFHLILGGSHGVGIPFKRFAQLFKWDYGITPHCNCIRGHVALTYKAKLIQTLRQASLDHITPETFLYFPSTAEDNELEGLRVASESGSKRGESNNTWIAKSSDATRGERTLISSDYEEIENVLESQEKTSPAWTVQKYISNPLLLPGGFKFDLRFFVLIDSKLDGFVTSQGVVKTCKDPFSMDDLTNKAAHLSHASIQGTDNETRFPVEQLSKWLSAEHGVSYDSSIVQPVHTIIAQVIEAAKSKLQNADHVDFTSFQVFAFDFIVDADFKIWFLEASSPIEFPSNLVDEMALDVLDLAIKPLFDSDDSRDQQEGQIFQPLGSPKMPQTQRSSSNNNKK